MSNKMLSVALQAVRAAEKVILHYYQPSVRVKLKHDQSPVTLADTAAERIIIKTIRKHFPEHSFLGEELGGTEKRRTYRWIIDPIDGTKNYVRQIPLFATQLALMKGRKFVLGVSNAPALKELLYAETGKGAFANGKKINVSKVSRLSESALSFGGINQFKKHHQLSSLLALDRAVRLHRGFGDAWSYHLLAQGKIDIMVEAQIKIWDIAAAKVIVEEAGGKMTDMFGREIDLSTASAVASNKKLHRNVVRYFSEHRRASG